MKFKVPQPYKDLGVAFFLHLSPVSEEELKKHHVAQTRKLHPDLLPLDASDEEREAQESKLAALNSAFLRLRDAPARIDLVIEQILADNPELKNTEKPQLPRELAMEYFDLQEALEENPSDPATKEALGVFHAAVRTESLALSREIENFVATIPIDRGPEEVSAPADGLADLIKLRNRERYLRSLQSDLEKKLS
jgi:hypothetical protein